jgi:hypothetical protein
LITVFQIAPCAKESSKEEGGRGENSYPSEEGRIGKDGKRSGERASADKTGQRAVTTGEKRARGRKRAGQRSSLSTY